MIVVSDNQNIGFDDLPTKIAHLEDQYQNKTAQWVASLAVHGKDSLEAKVLRRQCWELYLEGKQAIIEGHVSNDELRLQCILYTQNLYSSYSLKKAKQLLDEFVTIIQKPRNWLTVQLFMRRNPIT